MTYHCYILVSDSSGKLYIGQTNDLSDRIRRHNEGYNLATRNRGTLEITFFNWISNKGRGGNT
ncbi:MAG: GIY-YIG nuclease family protein [Cyclobacteriaceae bacterium]|nr:GIY-YIG nuclease family protein [Cyclobacteriaceae bacterium]